MIFVLRPEFLNMGVKMARKRNVWCMVGRKRKTSKGPDLYISLLGQVMTYNSYKNYLFSVINPITPRHGYICMTNIRAYNPLFCAVLTIVTFV